MDLDAQRPVCFHHGHVPAAVLEAGRDDCQNCPRHDGRMGVPDEDESERCAPAVDECRERLAQAERLDGRAAVAVREPTQLVEGPTDERICLVEERHQIARLVPLRS